MTLQLQPHQVMAKDFIVSHPYCGLFAEVGVGKSVITLSALAEINPHTHVLIIGPKPVVRATWIEEINKWGFSFRINSLIVNDKGRKLSSQKRHEKYKEVFNEKPTIYFINRELIPDLVDSMPEVSVGKGKTAKIWPFGVVIVDESQSFKAANSKRFKALALVRPAIQRLILLSGTPSPNGLIDLWSQIYLLDMGQRLGQFISHYRQRYFTPSIVVDDKPVKWKLLPGADEAIYNQIDDIVISMRNLKANMPAVTYNDEIVTLSPDEFAIYEQMRKENVLEFMPEDTDKLSDKAKALFDKLDKEKIYALLAADPTTLTKEELEICNATKTAIAANAGVVSAKLTQIASGTVYLKEEDGTTSKKREFKRIHERKLERLMEIIEQAGSPVLVLYWFKSDLAIIEEKLQEAKINYSIYDGSPEMITQWNNNEFDVMLLHPASAGHGINLQYGDGHTVVWFTMTWNLECYIQANARIYRQGNKNPVIIHHLIAGRTIDRRILNAIKGKKASMNELTDAVLAEVLPTTP